MRLCLPLLLLAYALSAQAAPVPVSPDTPETASAAQAAAAARPVPERTGQENGPAGTRTPALAAAPSFGAATINHLLTVQVPERMEFCGEPVPLHRADVTERLDLELMVILGSPVSTTLWFKRMPRYFPLVEAELERRGLPQDLKYVTLIESNLRASAISSAGAVGPWQFVGSTGREMGLERRAWKDERRDWEKATAAALDYLSSLHESFGSWPAALAAYNSGRRRVSRAMEDQQHTSYYDLVLPRETERYVFRALAAKLVIEHPEVYGIRTAVDHLYAPLEAVALEFTVRRRKLPLAAIAQAAGVPYRELRRFNPWLMGAPLPRGSYRIQVPTASVDAFDTKLARWEAANPEPQQVYYRVRRGDTLSAIARRHSVSLGALLRWNSLTSRSVIRPGQEIMIQLVD